MVRRCCGKRHRHHCPGGPGQGWNYVVLRKNRLGNFQASNRREDLFSLDEARVDCLQAMGMADSSATDLQEEIETAPPPLAIERNALRANQISESIAADRGGHAGVDRRLDVLGAPGPDTGGAGDVAGLSVKPVDSALQRLGLDGWSRSRCWR